MRKRRHENLGAGSLGMGDLMMNCLLAILIVMFVFMVNQGVKAVASQVDQTLLAELMAEQQQAIDDAASQVQTVIDVQQRQHKQGQDRERLLQGEIKDLQKRITKSRSASSLRIDLLPDCTGSMGDVLESIKTTVVSLSRALPIALTEVEIGCQAYRNMKLSGIPIETVHSREDDGGTSIDRVNKFVSILEANGGIANIEQAIRASMGRFDAMPGSPRECLTILGDVGTREVNPEQPAVAKQLIADVKAWCEFPGKNRRVLAIYTGTLGSVDEAFFQDLGSVNEASMFSADYEQLFELILSAAFSPQEATP